MAIIQRSVLIQAPVEKVFGFITTPTNLPGVWPNLLEVKDVQPLPDGQPGKRFRFTYRMAGLHLEGISETIYCSANEKNVSRTRGGVESTVTWTFQPGVDGTRLTFEGEYKVPVPLVGALAEPLILRQNEQMVEQLLENLKVRLEQS